MFGPKSSSYGLIFCVVFVLAELTGESQHSHSKSLMVLNWDLFEGLMWTAEILEGADLFCCCWEDSRD